MVHSGPVGASIPGGDGDEGEASGLLLERMARAMARANGDNPDYVSWTGYERLARSGLEALRAQQGESHGRGGWNATIDRILYGRA